MHGDRDTHRKVGLNIQERRHPQLAKIMESSDHAWSGDGSSNTRQENIGKRGNIRNINIIREQEHPIEERYPKPNDHREQDVDKQIPHRMKKFQALDEFIKDIQNFLRKLFRERPQEKRKNGESFFFKKIHRQYQKQQEGGNRNPKNPPK
jgi:hypothetical protein